MSKKNKEKSVIQTCIDKSIWIIYAIIVKDQLKWAKFIANHVPVRPPDMDKFYTSVVESWDDRIDDWKRTIARFLNKRFEARGIKTEDKFWFSKKDLIDGYVFLYKHEPIVSSEFFKESSPDFVLFLTDFTDCFNGKQIKSGDILPLDDVKHNIKKKGHIPGVLSKNNIIIWYERKTKQYGT